MFSKLIVNGSRLCEAVDFEKTKVQLKTKDKMENKNSNLTPNPPFCKADVSGSFLDKNGIELQSGSVINIHQTVNGENLFVMLDIQKLDLRYGFNLAYEYQYAVTDLLSPNHFNGDIEWEIVGSLNTAIENYR